LIREVVVSIDRGMKTLLRTIWKRQSGSVLGSESKENVVDSAVKTLEGGIGAATGRGSFERGVIEIPGSSPAWTLWIRSDQLVADR